MIQLLLIIVKHIYPSAHAPMQTLNQNQTNGMWTKIIMVLHVYTCPNVCNTFITGNTVANRSSLYSMKISAVVCCSQCREPAFEPPAAVDEEERRSLIESYREQLLTSSVHKPLQDNDFECSLAT